MADTTTVMALPFPEGSDANATLRDAIEQIEADEAADTD